jgi:membrane-bound metal-dependent hydrolase YbcI (DUF457 family)
MFIGHFAVGFAAKRAVPSVSLGTWFIACELIDLIWPVLLLAGIERVSIQPGITAFTPLDFEYYPWTHSLLMCAAWALGMAALYWLARRSSFAALLVGLVVLSHWFLDAIAHRPDLPLAPGSDTKIGFGLWHSVGATLGVETLLFAAGLAFYLAGSRARDAIGRWGLWGMLLLLLVSYAGAAFGPPPPGVAAIAWAGLAGGLIFGALGYWVDRHREVRA